MISDIISKYITQSWTESPKISIKLYLKAIEIIAIQIKLAIYIK